MHTVLPSPSAQSGVPYLRKEVEVRGSGSQHHQLCRHHNLQLIQSRVAPSHGPPARVLSPLFFPAKFLLLPKPCGDPKSLVLTLAQAQRCPLRQSCVFLHLEWLPRLGLNPSTSLPLQPHSQLLLQSVIPVSIPVFFQLYWAAIVDPSRRGPRAWSRSFPSSPTSSCNQGELLPTYLWGGSHSHLPGSKLGHSYLTYP